MTGEALRMAYLEPRFGGSRCVVTRRGMIFSIYTVPTRRGCGDASAMLDWICEMADISGAELRLFVEPFGKFGLSTENVAKFYLRKRFRSDGVRHGILYMKRKPVLRLEDLRHETH